MATLKRSATGVWHGTLKAGNGQIGTDSGVLQETPFSFKTRFQNEQGTNPEELIAAAHAACFSMAFSNYLDEQGHTPEEVHTEATVTMEGTEITKVHLKTRGRVPGVDAEQFKRLADEADKKCPVSNLLRPGLEISRDAELAS